MEIGRDFNAAADLISGNLKAGRGGKIAYIDDGGQLSFGELAERVNRFGNTLLAMGLRMEDRILIAMHDSIDWPVAFLGAIKAGIVPVAVNTLLTPKDYEYMLADSRAKALLVSEPLKPQFEPFLKKLPFLKHVISSPFKDLTDKSSGELATAPTTSDDPCFWLYSSGSTGMPKGTVHVHSSMRLTTQLYAQGVLGLNEFDVVFSAAKLFFAYGLGNSLSFPLAVGATTVLMAERPAPDAVFKRLVEKKPTLFFGVPTLYAGMLASPAFPRKEVLNLRTCISAGEALPPQIAKSFKQRTGIDILDGIGSTEMLHIFLSNRPGHFRYGTTGKAVPGYELRVVDEQGVDVKQGELGELLIKGPSAANLYWNNRVKSRSTFVGEWTRSGDKYSQDADGYYVYGGRTDDMLKVSGIWVSPAEVEAALVSHQAVLEAAVVGKEDEHQLVKPKAFVVLKPGQQVTTEELQNYVKAKLAPYKYPRWIEFLAELPKTATGKIQRFKLRS
ncbi:MAG: benzoate-CoA ligase family protein [Betaproteobacteria bacterium]|nr:benzoate-CoA ligase family protein [Betaproteobacteria bacterium]MSQ89241.1 benzoate-CoA ligase family protein [Betaproteobacteria bacterium]